MQATKGLKRVATVAAAPTHPPCPLLSAAGAPEEYQELLAWRDAIFEKHFSLADSGKAN